MKKNPLFKKREKEKRKCFVLVTGRTLNSERTFMELLRRKIKLKEVQTEQESEIILVFCPVVSRAGTNIEAELQKLNDLKAAESKPVVFVMLHRTLEPDRPVPDSNRYLNRPNAIAVDCLFHEDRGLLKCRKNDESLTKTISSIKPQLSRRTSTSHEAAELQKETLKLKAMEENLNEMKLQLEEVEKSLTTKDQELQKTKTELDTIKEIMNTPLQEHNTALDDKDQQLKMKHKEKLEAQEQIEELKEQLWDMSKKLNKIMQQSTDEETRLEDMNELQRAEENHITNPLRDPETVRDNPLAETRRMKRDQDQEILFQETELQRQASTDQFTSHRFPPGATARKHWRIQRSSTVDEEPQDQLPARTPFTNETTRRHDGDSRRRDETEETTKQEQSFRRTSSSCMSDPHSNIEPLPALQSKVELPKARIRVKRERSLHGRRAGDPGVQEGQQASVTRSAEVQRGAEPSLGGQSSGYPGPAAVDVQQPQDEEIKPSLQEELNEAKREIAMIWSENNKLRMLRNNPVCEKARPLKDTLRQTLRDELKKTIEERNERKHQSDEKEREVQKELPKRNSQPQHRIPLEQKKSSSQK